MAGDASTWELYSDENVYVEDAPDDGNVYARKHGQWIDANPYTQAVSDITLAGPFQIGADGFDLRHNRYTGQVEGWVAVTGAGAVIPDFADNVEIGSYTEAPGAPALPAWKCSTDGNPYVTLRFENGIIYASNGHSDPFTLWSQVVCRVYRNF